MRTCSQQEKKLERRPQGAAARGRRPQREAADHRGLKDRRRQKPAYSADPTTGPRACTPVILSGSQPRTKLCCIGPKKRQPRREPRNPCLQEQLQGPAADRTRKGKGRGRQSKASMGTEGLFADYIKNENGLDDCNFVLPLVDLSSAGAPACGRRSRRHELTAAELRALASSHEHQFAARRHLNRRRVLVRM